MKLSSPVVEPDEAFHIITIVTNRRRRFLPFIRLDENVPQGIKSERELYVENYTEHRCLLRSTVYMMPRQRLTRRTRVSMPERGRYLFLGATLYGGDFLGLSEKARAYPLERELVVLPRPLPEATVERLTGGWMGDMSVNRFILEDPIMTLGFREYTGREPMKQISWTQSARANRLMVRRFDYTVERTATVILNVNTFAFGSFGKQLLELCFSLARSVCELLEEKRIPYAFLTNLKAAGMEKGFGETVDGLGRGHLATALEGLGRADGNARESLEALLDRAAARASIGQTHIFITPTRRDLHPEPLERLRAASGVAPLTLVAEEVKAL